MSPTIDDAKYDIYYDGEVDRDTSASWDMVKMPMESIEGKSKGDIRFVLEESNRYWMDVSNAFIKFEARIVKTDGSAIVAGDGKFCFVNNSAHSLFEDLRIKINETLVFGGTMDYPYTAYMFNHLQYSHAVKSTVKILEGYTPPSLDADGKDFTDWGSKYTTALYEMVKGGEWARFILPLNIASIFNQGKALPPSHSIQINLVRNNPKFCIWAEKSATNLDFELRDMTIHMPMVEPTPKIQAQIAERSKNSYARYEYPHLQMFRHVISKGTQVRTLYNVFQNKVVRMAFFVLIPSDSVTDQQKRKFIFPKLDMEISLRTEGRHVTGYALNANKTKEAYEQFVNQLHLLSSNEDNGINLDEFERYSNIYPYDCTNSGNIESRQGEGGLKRQYNLDLKFTRGLTENHDVLCFFVEDRDFQLGPGQQVISADYSKKK